VEQRIVHPDFEQYLSINHDVALLKMDKPVNFNDYIKPVCLPFKSDPDPNVFKNNFATITGEKH